MSSIKLGDEKGGREMPTEKGIHDEPDLGDVLPLEDNLKKLECETEYPSGISFMLLTIGLMAVVLVLALDNYIICESQAS